MRGPNRSGMDIWCQIHTQTKAWVAITLPHPSLPLQPALQRLSLRPVRVFEWMMRPRWRAITLQQRSLFPRQRVGTLGAIGSTLLPDAQHLLLARVHGLQQCRRHLLVHLLAHLLVPLLVLLRKHPAHPLRLDAHTPMEVSVVVVVGLTVSLPPLPPRVGWHRQLVKQSRLIAIQPLVALAQPIHE